MVEISMYLRKENKRKLIKIKSLISHWPDVSNHWPMVADIMAMTKLKISVDSTTFSEESLRWCQRPLETGCWHNVNDQTKISKKKLLNQISNENKEKVFGVEEMCKKKVRIWKRVWNCRRDFLVFSRSPFCWERYGYPFYASKLDVWLLVVIELNLKNIL